MKLLLALPVTALLGATCSLVAPAEAAPPSCHGQRATIVGTAGNDRITGTAQADVIVALGGDDVVTGGGGDDLVCAGDGADRLAGGPGDDRLFGQRDGIGTDRGGSYRVPDELTGGPGDDVLDIGADGRRVDQEGGHGIVTYATAGGPIRVDLDRGTARGAGRDRIVPMAGLEVVGSAFGDHLAGGAGPDHLVGGGGDDTLLGLGGADLLLPEGYDAPHRNDRDTVDGGPGNDTIVARFGRDVLHGGSGDDHVTTWSSKPSEVYGDAGDDVVEGAVAGHGFVLDGGEGDDRGYLGRPARTTRPESEPGPTITVREADGVVEREGEQIGTLLSIGDLELASRLRWVYLGTEDADVVTGGYYWPFRAETFGGDDVVTGSGKRDRIDAGDGTDRVVGNEGRDTCLNAEEVTSCEVLAE
jgi:Ca2+-binding RTX toxin-like protein